MTTKLVAIGIDLGGTNIKAGLSDNSGKIIKRVSVVSPVKDGRDAVLEAIINVGLEIKEYALKNDYDVVAIGAGSPGVIDSVRGVVLGNTPNLPDWGGMYLKDELSSALSLPCEVDNDANLFMLAECLYGAAKGYGNAIGLTLGTGIGGGIIIDGKIHHGSGFSAGEIGHIPIVANGKKCKCGLKGCLEVYASAPALVKAYKRASSVKSKEIDAAGIFSRARTGDPVADKVVGQWCDYLATGIASAVNLLNPEVVVLGGGVASAGEYLRKRVRISLEGRILKEAARTLKVRIAELSNDAGWLGAVANALESLRHTLL